MSIKPEYADKILSGKKKVEIRRKFSSKWIGHRLGVYASRPSQSLVGEALIDDVISGSPEEIWNRFELQIGCSKEEFDNYTESRTRISAIILKDILPYNNQIPLAEISIMINKELKPPQSYCKLDRKKPLGTAVSIAAMLQNHLHSANPLLVPSV